MSCFISNNFNCIVCGTVKEVVGCWFGWSDQLPTENVFVDCPAERLNETSLSAWYGAFKVWFFI